MVDAYARTTRRDGVILNYRTLEMFEVAEMRAKPDRPWVLVQGSYTSSVSASAGTHSGGGALDVRARDRTAKEIDSMVFWLRKMGFAAWHRTVAQGFDSEHVHGIAIGDKELSDGAKVQVVAYRNGRNGLANNGPDDGPQVDYTVYKQEIDLSYYGPERWDDADFDRFEKKVGWKRDISNFNTNPPTQIDAMVSLSYAHQHATDADEQATKALAGVVAVSGKADQTLAKLDEILGKLPPPA